MLLLMLIAVLSVVDYFTAKVYDYYEIKQFDMGDGTKYVIRLKVLKMLCFLVTVAICLLLFIIPKTFILQKVGANWFYL